MASSALGPFATLDSVVLAGHDYSAFLTHREREESLRFRVPARKTEWLAARLASKFLFLTNHRGHVAASELHRFSACTYQSIQVTRDDRINFGIPQVRRGDECRNVAISHSGGVVCVMLGDGDTIAVDVERVEARTSVFYRRNFTEGERAEAEGYRRRLGLDPNWTLTLLWSIKECLLKTPAYNELSVWDMPTIDVRVVAGSESLIRVRIDDFVFITVEVVSRKGTDLRRVGVSRLRDRVIALICGGDRRMV